MSTVFKPAALLEDAVESLEFWTSDVSFWARCVSLSEDNVEEKAAKAALAHSKFCLGKAQLVVDGLSGSLVTSIHHIAATGA